MGKVIIMGFLIWAVDDQPGRNNEPLSCKKKKKVPKQEGTVFVRWHVVAM